MKALFTLQPGSDGKRIRLTTNTAADVRVKYRVLRNGAFTGFFIAVPYSLMVYGSQHLEIGTRKLRVNHNQKTVEGDIPDAWLVDLSQDIPQDIAEEWAAAA